MAGRKSRRIAEVPEASSGNPRRHAGGGVMDLLERRLIDFNNIRYVVLDEVDRMLDIGFRDDIRRILSQVKGAVKSQPGDNDPSGDGSSSPRSHQTMFVSATISPEIDTLARKYMRRAGGLRKLIRADAPMRSRPSKRWSSIICRLSRGISIVCFAHCCSRKIPTSRSSSAARNTARKNWLGNFTPMELSAARFTATSPRTSATAS